MAAGQMSLTSFDPRNLEIKTKSVEQTLLPLVTQISTLVNFKENIIAGSRPKSERALRAALKIGSAVEAAVERFVVVGETIADENPDIQPEMYDACQEARSAGALIANLHNSIIDEVGQSTIGIDKSQLIKAARRLLSSVTRVLLLADRVLVKHILRAEDKIVYSLTKLENTMNFTEFVKIFTEFGGQMVDLAHRTGDRQNDLKSEKRQAQMWVARSCLERLTMLLLTSSKTLLRHPEDQAAKQCRDGVFHQIRISLQLVGICVSDGILPFDPTCYCVQPESGQLLEGPIDIGIQLTANVCIKQLTEMLDMVKMMALIGTGVQERLVSALDSLCEMTQDFTDSAYTAHHHREQILDYLEECRFEMSSFISSQLQDMNEHMRSEIIDVAVERLNRRLKDLRKQLQAVALDQVAAVFRANDDQTILSSIKTCSVSGDIDGVEKYMEKFREHAEHLQELCRLLHHVSVTDALHVYTGHAERNLRALTPLTLLAGRTLCIHPSSRIARENLEVFCDTWAANVNDLSRLAKDLDAAASSRTAAEKQAYMSLPRPGVSSPNNGPALCVANPQFCERNLCRGWYSAGGVSPVSNPESSHSSTQNSQHSHISLPSISQNNSACVYMSNSHSNYGVVPKYSNPVSLNLLPNFDLDVPKKKNSPPSYSQSTTTSGYSTVGSSESNGRSKQGHRNGYAQSSGPAHALDSSKIEKEEVVYSTVNKPKLSSPISSTEHSAFTKYHKIDQSATPVADHPTVQLRANSNPKPVPSPAALAAPHPNPTILRQDGRSMPSGSKSEKTSQYQTVSAHKNGKAPLAVCDEDDEDLNLNGNEMAPVSRSKRFENRISQILEDLHLEAESLRQLQFSTNNSKRAKHGAMQKPTKPITLDVEDQQKIAKVGLEMKLLTAEVEAEAEKWDEYAENDIVKRAKAMSAMSYNMYLFTKGDGPLKTTHDLFTQAEFFAETANKMFKTVKEFAFEVPGSPEKNELQVILEKIPLHCQQLQVLVKSPTVGKSATFSKVDSVISETKSLMNEIAMLVTACFVCATKFEIEFRGTSMSRSGLIDGGDFTQRGSRESTMWRRTPSMRRTPQISEPPPSEPLSSKVNTNAQQFAHSKAMILRKQT